MCCFGTLSDVVMLCSASWAVHHHVPSTVSASRLLTPAAIARLKWPGGQDQRWQIASCEGIGAGARAGDVQSHIWDVRRPAVALYSPRGHREVCTGLAFAAPPGSVAGDLLLSISKEPRLLSHSLCALDAPYAHVPPVCISWSPLDDLVTSSSPTIVALRKHHAGVSAVAESAKAAAAAAAVARRRTAQARWEQWARAWEREQPKRARLVQRQ